MTTEAEIAAAQARLIRKYTADPASARSTKAVEARLEEGLSVRIGDGRTEVVADMPAGIGGGETGPTPGFYARAGIASCVAVGVRLAALREGLPVDGITVSVETDFDDGALLGVGENPAAPLATRVAIRVESAAPPAQIEALVARALEADPWFLALRDAQQVAARVDCAAPA